MLNSYSNKLTDREQIHLFIFSSAGLPFALGTRINTNIYPYVQTYKYDRMQTPKFREAILITKEVNDRVVLSEEDRKVASIVRQQWEFAPTEMEEIVAGFRQLKGEKIKTALKSFQVNV